MVIERDALLRVVKAARISIRMQELMRKMTVENTATWADEIAGNLEDALFMLIGEKLGSGDFSESFTMKLLQGSLSDGEVADWIITMHGFNNAMRESHTKQPEPQTMSPAEVDEMYEQNGGYRLDGKGGRNA